MYYVINLKTEIKGKKSEVYVFPFINRAKDIVSGQLNLESNSVYNLSEKYDTLLRLAMEMKIKNLLRNL